jgi:hypothetical protein
MILSTILTYVLMGAVAILSIFITCCITRFCCPCFFKPSHSQSQEQIKRLADIRQHLLTANQPEQRMGNYSIPRVPAAPLKTNIANQPTFWYAKPSLINQPVPSYQSAMGR